MTGNHFFHKLAIERCQYHLAQLCAIMFLQDRCGDDGGDNSGPTIQALIESLNKDLSILSGFVDDSLPQDAEAGDRL